MGGGGEVRKDGRLHKEEKEEEVWRYVPSLRTYCG